MGESAKIVDGKLPSNAKMHIKMVKTLFLMTFSVVLGAKIILFFCISIPKGLNLFVLL